MATLSISLSDSLKNFVDEQVGQRGYRTGGEYVRELIRKDRDQLRLRKLLLAGVGSPRTRLIDGAYFESLRRRVRSSKPTAHRGRS